MSPNYQILGESGNAVIPVLCGLIRHKSYYAEFVSGGLPPVRSGPLRVVYVRFS